MRYRRKYYFEPQTLADVIFLLLILNSFWTLTWLLIGSRKQVISHSDMTCMQHILQDGRMKARTKKGVRLFQTSDSSSSKWVTCEPLTLQPTLSDHGGGRNFSLHFLALVKGINNTREYSHACCWHFHMLVLLFPLPICVLPYLKAIQSEAHIL